MKFLRKRGQQIYLAPANKKLPADCAARRAQGGGRGQSRGAKVLTPVEQPLVATRVPLVKCASPGAPLDLGRHHQHRAGRRMLICRAVPPRAISRIPRLLWLPMIRRSAMTLRAVSTMTARGLPTRRRVFTSMPASLRGPMNSRIRCSIRSSVRCCMVARCRAAISKSSPAGTGMVSFS